VWFNEPVGEEEVDFQPNVFLLRKDVAVRLKEPPVQAAGPVTVETTPTAQRPEAPAAETTTEPSEPQTPSVTRLRLRGQIPWELWNRLGRQLIPKVSNRENLSITVEVSFDVAAEHRDGAQRDLKQALADLGLAESVGVEAE